MEFKKKPQSSVLQRQPQMVQAAQPAPEVQRQALIQRDLQRHTARPTTTQRQVAAPALKAAQLHRAEVQHLSEEQTSIQRQAAEINLPQSAVDAALQRQQAVPAPVATKPQSIGDWVTVMRFQAEQSEGRRMGAKEASQFSALQRQVAQTLTRSYLTDRQSALQRQQDYAGHVVALQRHPVSGQVARAFMLSVPQGEKAALQRAVDEVSQQEALQRQRDEQALRLHSLQRQLAELNEQATRPVFERIQQRRGAGNPLPQAIQRHLEQGLNHDLSAVRIHDDQEADKLAKKVNAVAFTTGQDIYFRAGKYDPNSQSGLELLAHEVTHTVQQARGEVGPGLDPSASHETQAREMGRKLSKVPVTTGRHIRTVAAQTASVSDALRRGALQRLQTKEESPFLQTLTTGQAPSVPFAFVWHTTDGGVNVRETIGIGGKVLVNVPNATRVQLLRYDPKQHAYAVRTPSGVQGWVVDSHLKVPPVQLARDANLRFYVPKDGEGIFSVVQREYGAMEFGQDARYFTNVIRAVNKSEAFMVKDPKYKGFLDAAFEKTVTAMTDGRDANAIQLKKATPFWLPSLAGAKQVKAHSGSFSKGVIEATKQTFGEAGEKALYGGLFLTGLQIGVLKSLWEALVGLVELVKLPISIIKNIYNVIETALKGQLLNKIEQVYDFLAGGGLKQVADMLVGEFRAGWDNKNPLKAWEFRGQTIGYVVTEIVTAFIPIAGILLKTSKIAKLVAFIRSKFQWIGVAGQKAMQMLDKVKVKLPPTGMSPQMAVAGGMTMSAPQKEISLGEVLRMAKERSAAEKARREAVHQSRLQNYVYDAKRRTEKELKADLSPAPRTGETAQAAQARVAAATAEIAFRQRYKALGAKPWRPNLKENDATFPRAHTLDRHGAGLSMQDMEDRVMGAGRWAGKAESFAYKWISDDLADRTIQEYIEKNWERIREALARDEAFRASFDTGHLVGRGYYNQNISIPGAQRLAVKGETSWVQIVILLDPSGKPFVLTAFPKGSFH